MINTGPTGKSVTGAAQMAGQAAGQYMRPPAKKAPMRKPSISRSGASGSGVGPSFAMNPGFKSVNATGAIGPQSKFGGGGPMGGAPTSPGQRFQGDPLMAGDDMGPVAQTAPPMFAPPQMGGGGMMPSMEGGMDPMMVENLKRRMNQRNTGVTGGSPFMQGMY